MQINQINHPLLPESEKQFPRFNLFISSVNTETGFCEPDLCKPAFDSEPAAF